MKPLVDETAPDLPRKTRRAVGYSWRRIVARLLIVLSISCLGLGGLSMTAQRPSNLGVHGGRLTECPATPNSVSTQTGSPDHRMTPIPFVGSITDEVEKIKQTVAKSFPRARLIAERDGYLYYEFSSLLFRFIDDVEFLVDDRTREIHFRSASRVGHSDLGANRRRMMQLTEELKR